jgi:hypothetical protein
LSKNASENTGVTDTAAPEYLFGRIPLNGIEVVFDRVNTVGGIENAEVRSAYLGR